MAKSRNKKKNNDAVSMDISTYASTDLPQAMDTSETTLSKPAPAVVNRKTKKGVPMKRSKNLRKMKAIEKAVSKSEQVEAKISKNKVKILRVQSAKTLYE